MSNCRFRAEQSCAELKYPPTDRHGPRTDTPLNSISECRNIHLVCMYIRHGYIRHKLRRKLRSIYVFRRRKGGWGCLALRTEFGSALLIRSANGVTENGVNSMAARGVYHNLRTPDLCGHSTRPG